MCDVVVSDCTWWQYWGAVGTPHLDMFPTWGCSPHFLKNCPVRV